MVHIKFNSFEEFLDQVQKKRTKNAGTSSTVTRGHKWTLGDGWEESIRLAKEGWPLGSDKLKELNELTEIPSGARDFAPVSTLSLSGDEVDVGLHLTGEPECMLDWQIEETPSFGKVVKLVVSLVGNCGISSDALRRRGMFACLLVDMLEACGLRCEVWAVVKCCSDDDDRIRFLTEVCVKQSDEPVELDRLAFMLGHPSVFRRFGFRMMEQQPKGSWGFDQTKYGYGCSVAYPEHLRSEEDGVLYIGGEHSHQTDEQVIEDAKRLALKWTGSEEAVA